MKGQVLALKRTLVELWKKLWKKTENYHRESRPDLGRNPLFSIDL